MFGVTLSTAEVLRDRTPKELLSVSLFSQSECDAASVSEGCGGSEALRGRGSLLFYVRPNLPVKASLYLER